MSKVLRCDKCGSLKDVEDNELIEFLCGSICIENANLCEECFQIFAKLLDKFASSEQTAVKKE